MEKKQSFDVIYEKKTDTVSIVDPSEFKACDEIIKKYKKLDSRILSFF